MTFYAVRQGAVFLLVAPLVTILTCMPLAVAFADESASPVETQSGEEIINPDTDATEADVSLEGASASERNEDADTSAAAQGGEGETVPEDDEASALPAMDGNATSTEEASTTAPTDGEEGEVASDILDTSASSTSYELTGTSTPATTTISTSTNGGVDSTGSTTGETSIVSGDAIALANVLNLVNSNFINSDGVVVFKNFFDTLLDDFDLRNFYNSMLSVGCSLIQCSSDDVHTNIENGAVIDNELYVEAHTGGNTIENGGNASISTGNAYAGVNLVNVANTTVVDSNYLLLTMNAFQDVDGDIVFPSLSNFFNTLGGGASPAAVDITNTADVVNDIALDAQSGGNSASGNNSSTIGTGASAASGNVFNQLNTSLVGGQSVSIIFRVHGSWAGEIFGAPDNLGWMEDGEGGIYLFDKGGSGGTGGDGLSVSATNSASIHNNVNVVALTGDNAISGSQTALISTGNAYAGANIMNVANATVVGRNWILAIVNIFGDFNGNIAFGRPDLWIGGQAAVPKSIKKDSELKYTLTVINNGDSPASKVTLADEYDADHLDIYNASVPYTVDPAGKLLWQLPDLPPGKATEITYYGRVKDVGAGTDITNMVTVAGHETDNNKIDNTDTIVVTTDRESHGNGVRISLSSPGASASKNEAEFDVNMERTPAQAVVDMHKGENLLEHLRVSNDSGKKLSGVVVHDILRDPTGTVVKDEMWNIGDVQANEEINISYEIFFKDTAQLGLYTFNTLVEIENGADVLFERNGTANVWEGADLTMDIPAVPFMPAEPVVAGAYDAYVAPPTEVSEKKGISGLFPSAEAASLTSVPEEKQIDFGYGVYILLAALIGLGITYRFYKP